MFSDKTQQDITAENKSREVAANAVENFTGSTIVSTVRHPGLTFSTRLLTADVMSNLLLDELRNNGREEAYHYNLVWEANVPGSPNATRFDWRLLRVSGLVDPEDWSSKHVTIPWFKPMNYTSAENFQSIIGEEEKWLEVANKYAELFSLDPAELQRRISLIRNMNIVHYLESDGSKPLSMISTEMYQEMAKIILGEGCLAEFPYVPYMESAKKIVLPKLQEMGEQRVKEILTQEFPNGFKFLLYGYSHAGNEDEISYVGWSPQGKFLSLRDRVDNGKNKGNPKELSWDEIVWLIEQDQLEPISILALLAVFNNAEYLHQGADHGAREIADKYVDVNVSTLAEPHDSWAVLKVQMPNGEVTDPSIQELYLLFGENNPVLHEIFAKSIKTGAPVLMEFEELKSLITGNGTV